MIVREQTPKRSLLIPTYAPRRMCMSRQTDRHIQTHTLVLFASLFVFNLEKLFGFESQRLQIAHLRADQI